MQIRRIQPIYKICFVLMIIMLCIGLSVPIQYERFGTLLILLAFFFSILCSFWYVKHNNDEIHKKMIIQVTISHTFLTLFIILIIRQYYIMYGDSIRYKLLCIEGGIAFLFLLYCFALSQKWIRKLFTSLLNYWKKNKCFFLITILFVVFYIPCFTYLFKSDSYTYYNSVVSNLESWSFSFSDLSAFEIGYHKTYGYSLFVFGAAYLFNDVVFGIRFINLLIYLSTMFMIYELIKKIGNNKRKFPALIGTALYAFSPMVLGLAQEINTDMPISSFYIWFVFFGVFQWNLFFIISSLLLCFSKEIGIIFVLTYIAGVGFYRLFHNYKKVKTLKSLIQILTSSEWLTLCGPILFICCYFFNGSKWGEGNPTIEYQKGVINTIQFDLQYVIIKLKEIFLLNFQWLIVLGIFVLIVMCVKKKIVWINETLFAILTTGFFFGIFNLVYFTYTHSRYLYPLTFIYAILFACLLSACELRKISVILSLLIVILQGIQIFWQIDPISNIVFPKTSTGNGEIISLIWFTSDSNRNGKMIYDNEGADISSERFRDYVQINRTYEEFEVLFERVLDEIDYSEEDAIYLSPIFQDSFWGDLNWTLSNMLGVTNSDVIYWNPKTKQLTYNEKEGEKINWLTEVSKTVSKQYNNVWYIYLPYSRNDMTDYVDQSNINNIQLYEYNKWQIYAGEIVW